MPELEAPQPTGRGEMLGIALLVLVILLACIVLYVLVMGYGG